MEVTQKGEGTISARVIRADGTVEDLGVVAVITRPNRLKALARRIFRRR